MKSFFDGLIDSDEKVTSSEKHTQTKINALHTGITKMAENHDILSPFKGIPSYQTRGPFLEAPGNYRAR